MWEYGISRCKELAQHYELEVYDYVKLSSILVCLSKPFNFYLSGNNLFLPFDLHW